MSHVSVANINKNNVDMMFRKDESLEIWEDFTHITTFDEFMSHFELPEWDTGWESYSYDSVTNVFHLMLEDGSVVGFDKPEDNPIFLWIKNHGKKLTEYQLTNTPNILKCNYYKVPAPEVFGGELGDGIIWGSPEQLYEYLKGPQINRDDNHIFAYKMDYDRTKLFSNNHIKTSIITPIPTVPENFNKTFEEICLERAEELWTSEQQYLDVYWSGGVDSTVALVALILTAPSQLDIDTRLRVRSTILSRTEEYPLFYDNFIKDKINYAEIDDFEDSFDLENSMSITGEHGDQLFGSAVLVLNDELFDMKNIPWKSFDECIIMQEDEPEKFSKIEEFVSKSPQPIKTLYDLFTWCNFCLKWQNVTIRTYCLQTGLNASNVNNISHFFASDDFQIWSMVNLDKKIKDTNESYKWIAKDFIFDFTKDASYRDHKEKVGSLILAAGSMRRLRNGSANMPERAQGVFFDNKYNLIEWSPGNINHKFMKHRYGNKLDKFLKAV